MKRIIFLSFILFIHLCAIAQTVDDAVRYSLSKYSSTARSSAMGGAFGALGGDFSSISINPAGLGIYRAAELTFSSNLRMSNTKSSGLEEDKLSFSVDNIGAVFVFNDNRSKRGWQGINFAVGYNSMNNFNNRGMSRVLKSDNSYLDAWAEKAEQNPNNLNPFEEGLAKYHGLIVYNEEYENFDTWLSREEHNFDFVDKHHFIKEEGHQGEYVFAIGTNYSNKLFLGLNIGVQQIYYRSNSYYYEDILRNANNDNSDLLNFSYYNFLETTGDAINAKFGAIYKASNNLRLGIAYHSPTYYNMREVYYSTIESSFVNPDETYYDESDIGQSDYNFQTPSRTILSAAYIFGKRGILSVDYEVIDYSKSKFESKSYGYYSDRKYFNDLTEEVAYNLKSTYNLKVGGEYRVNSNISLRAGYALYNSPYKEINGNNNINRELLSGGIGFRQANFFMDISFVNTRFDEYSTYYAVYAVDDPKYDIISEAIKTRNNFNDVKITFGFKF